jgi:hypothetical protein
MRRGKTEPPCCQSALVAQSESQKTHCHESTHMNNIDLEYFDLLKGLSHL